MTFFPDRPDVLSRWRVRVEADAATCPVLLSNGNRTQAEQLEGGRHFTVWEVRFVLLLLLLHSFDELIMLVRFNPRATRLVGVGGGAGRCTQNELEVRAASSAAHVLGLLSRL